MKRNKLTEMMLGLEIDIRFISIKEAMKAGIMGEPAKIEAALHHPILLAIAGERDLTVLAEAMRQALTDAGFGYGVDDVVELFCDKNRREGMMAFTRRNPSYCMVYCPTCDKHFSAIALLPDSRCRGCHSVIKVAT